MSKQTEQPNQGHGLIDAWIESNGGTDFSALVYLYEPEALVIKTIAPLSAEEKRERQTCWH